MTDLTATWGSKQMLDNGWGVTWGFGGGIALLGGWSRKVIQNFIGMRRVESDSFAEALQIQKPLIYLLNSSSITVPRGSTLPLS